MDNVSDALNLDVHERKIKFNQLLQNSSHPFLKMLKFIKGPTRSTTEDDGNPYRK